MKKIFFTSLIVLLFANSFVFSQGLPEVVTITERTVIKDKMGQVLKLSECTNFLISSDWVLQPEKNEQGKVLYLLLRKTTELEKELLSEAPVSSIDKKDLRRVKRGKFYQETQGYGPLQIRRRRKKQLESNYSVDGEKETRKYQITWLDDASYILNASKNAEIDAETLRYKLVEVTDEYYIARVVGKSYLGETVKVFFKK